MVNGHIVLALLVALRLLSVPQRLLQFALWPPDDVIRFDDQVKCELRVVASLVVVASANLAPAVQSRAYCSDASLFGYALHSAELGSAPVTVLASCRERWRFEPPRPAVSSGAAQQSSESAAQLSDFDRWADILVIDTDRVNAAAAALSTSRAALDDDCQRTVPTLLRLLAEDELGDHPDRIPRDRGAFGEQSMVPIPAEVWRPSFWRREVVGAGRRPGKIHNFEARIALEGLATAVRDGVVRCSEVLSSSDNYAKVLC